MSILCQSGCILSLQILAFGDDVKMLNAFYSLICLKATEKKARIFGIVKGITKVGVNSSA